MVYLTSKRKPKGQKSIETYLYIILWSLLVNLKFRKETMHMVQDKIRHVYNISNDIWRTVLILESVVF